MDTTEHPRAPRAFSRRRVGALLAAASLFAASSSAQTLSNPSLEDPYLPVAATGVSGVIAGGWNDNTSWAPGINITYSRDTVNPRAGIACQRIQVNAGFAQFTQGLTLQPGRTSASVWMRASTPMWVALYLRGGASSDYRVYGSTPAWLSTSWQQVSVTAPTPLDPDAGLFINSAETGTFWVDDASLTHSVSPAAPPESLSPPGTPIPRSYFGLHPQHQFEPPLLPWPGIDFGTARSHDSAPFWANIEPNAPVAQPGGQLLRTFDWTNLDAFVDNAQSRGIRIIYTFYQTPSWAATTTAPDPYGADGGNSMPSDIAYYAGFASAVANRYRGRIAAYEVWNEPDLSFWVGTPAQMAALENACAAAVRAADPQALIIAPPPSGGGMYLSPMVWYDKYLAAGGAQAADIISCHFYSDAPEDDLAKSRVLRSLLARYGLSGKPLWHDEAGIGYDGTGDPAAVAAYVGRAYILNWANHIPMFAWYAWSERSLLGPRQGPTGSWNLLTSPAVAYGQVKLWLQDATMSSCGSDPQGRWTASLLRDGHTDLVAWSPAGTTTLALPANATRARALDGTSTTLNGQTSLTIGPAPLLIEVGRTGACCTGTSCSITAPGSCAPANYRGDGVACGPPANPTACCPVNVNGIGGVTVQDLFDFLGFYFVADARGDFNQSGNVTVQDIFDFVAAFFTGCT